MTSTQQPEWQSYYESHHGHVGLGHDHPLRNIEFEANFARFLPPPPASILEIGFGQGATLRTLAERGYQDLHGWDISRDCVERARQAQIPAQVELVDGIDALGAGAPARYDVILAKDLLEHLPRERLVEFLRGVHRALRPGGVFLARLPNMANPLSVYLRYDDFTHTLGFTESSLRQVFTLAGFERADIALAADVLPGTALLRRGLLKTFFYEKLLGPLVRWCLAVAMQSQRKGPAKVGTLRIIVAARKRGA